MKSKWSRREVLGAAGVLTVSGAVSAETAPLNSMAGVDRVTILPGKTHLRGWAGYGDPPRSNRPRGSQPEAPPETGPATTALWSKESGPGS